MRVGILSDTHGKFPAARAAIALLQNAQCEFLIHCGDVGSTQILDLLARIPSWFVFGNTDYQRDELRTYGGTIGVKCMGTGGIVPIEEKKLAVTHGDDPEKIQALLKDEPDYLFTGHTHIAKDVKQGKTRWINPGALHRAAVKSVVVLDLAKDNVEFLKV